jgi:tRNA A58 N-methylase Trm61
MLWQLLILIGLIGVSIILLLLLKKQLVRAYVNLNGAFYAPTSKKRIKQIAKLAQLKPGMKVVDLGAGDGRILIELVKTHPGITGVGIELDPKYVKLAKENVKRAGLSKKIKIKAGSYWKEDLSQYDVITLYLVQRFMRRMEKKLKREIKLGAKVISVFFHFPSWKALKRLGDIRLYGKSSSEFV